MNAIADALYSFGATLEVNWFLSAHSAATHNLSNVRQHCRLQFGPGSCNHTYHGYLTQSVKLAHHKAFCTAKPLVLFNHGS